MSVTIDENTPIKELRDAPKEGPVTIKEALVLLSTGSKKFDADIAKLPNLQVGDENATVWLDALKLGLKHLMEGDVFKARLAEEEAEWTNRPTYDGRPLTASRLKGATGGGVISGESAILKVKAIMGMGSIIPIPLWHSGFWITLKAPSNASIFELNKRISEEKITLGRMTNGMVFSNTGVYIQSHLVNFILANLYDTNLETKDPQALKELILSTDVPSLIWGILCTMYPDGYELREPCVAQITKCNHVSVGRVNIARLRVVDTNRLTEKQMKHMSRRNSKLTNLEVDSYRNEFEYGTRNVLVDKERSISLNLKVPTVKEFEENGFTWVDGIANMVDQSFRIPLKGNARDQYITDQGRVSALRQYSHWVGSIILGDGEDASVIEDHETIDGVLSEWSADMDIRTAVLNGIGEYVEDTTMAIIGFPNTPCPKCGLRHGDSMVAGENKGDVDVLVEGEDVQEFIPLDLTTTFFTLCEQRLQPAVQRTLS